MQEIIQAIRNAQNEDQLYRAGKQMREFLADCKDMQVKRLIISARERKSVQMKNPRRLTTNF